MAEPQTVNCGIIVPNTGDLVGTWGSAAVNPDFVAIDGYLGGVQTVSLSSAPVTLTSPAAFTPTPSGGPTQAQNAVIRLTGALSNSVTVTLPLPGYYIVENLTTTLNLALIVILRAIGSGEIIGLEQGIVQHVYNDGTNVRFVNLPVVGSYLDVCDATVPTWITACTKPPYLNCDGSTFSAVTYPYLDNKLGGTTLPDFRGRNGFYLNGGTGRLTSAGAGIDGNTRFASGGNNGLTASLLPTITSGGANSISVTSNNNVTQGPFIVAQQYSTGTQIQVGNFQGTLSSTATNNINVTSNNTSGISVGPNAAPGIVSGLRLIRAA